jgi:hypothetical protein
MNNTVKTALWGMVAMAGLLVATPAKADRLSFGLGVSDGYGSFFSFGLNSGGRGYGGPSHHGDGHGRGDMRGGCGYAMRQPCPPVVIYAPRPVVYSQPVICVPPPPPVVVPSGYWQERDERYWIDGNWAETYDAFGRRCKMWQPGRWETRRIREWVQQ